MTQTEVILITVLVFVVVITAVLTFRFLYQQQERTREANLRQKNAVNDAVADLIEDGALAGKPKADSDVILTAHPEKARDVFSKEILEAGMDGNKEVSVKTFHENLYRKQWSLKDLVNRRHEENAFGDFDTPNSRIQYSSNDNMAAWLPFLILGSSDGAGHNLSNDSYNGDSSYVGYTGDIGGHYNDSHGGHGGYDSGYGGGGFDGGGGGGGDGGGGGGGD